MKTLVQVIKESSKDKKDDDKKRKEIRKKLQFHIYKDDGHLVPRLRDNEDYQKIDCVYEESEDYNDGIKVYFLLGRKDDSWYLWAGKPGVLSYTDFPYKDLNTKHFAEALVNALDEAEDLILQIKAEPKNWVQYYVKQ